MKIVFLVALLLDFAMLVAQKDSVMFYINNYNKDITGNSKNISTQKEKELLAILVSHQKDTSLFKNVDIAYASTAIIKNLKNQKLRGIIIKQILGACSDNRTSKCNTAIASLRNFKTQEFEKKDKERILQRALLADFKDENVLLLGYLNFEKANDYLKKIDQSEQKTNWYVQLALARLGDEKAIKHCLQKVDLKKEPNFLLLHELVYIKQPELIDIYDNYLQSDGSSRKSYDVQSVPYTTIGIKYLSKLLVNFPLEDQVPAYTPDQIALARQWMLANQGKYKIRRDEY